MQFCQFGLIVLVFYLLKHPKSFLIFCVTCSLLRSRNLTIIACRQVVELDRTTNEHELADFHDFLYDFLRQSTGRLRWLGTGEELHRKECGRGDDKRWQFQLLIEQTSDMNEMANVTYMFNFESVIIFYNILQLLARPDVAFGFVEVKQCQWFSVFIAMYHCWEEKRKELNMMAKVGRNVKNKTHRTKAALTSYSHVYQAGAPLQCTLVWCPNQRLALQTSCSFWYDVNSKHLSVEGKVGCALVTTSKGKWVRHFHKSWWWRADRLATMMLMMLRHSTC